MIPYLERINKNNTANMSEAFEGETIEEELLDEYE